MSLTVEHINKSFAQVQAIKDLSMEVQEGAIFGFLGVNGAGKTTTMRMILDILRPDSSSITWNGQDVREVPRRNWGYLPEERGLYPKMRVDEQLLFLARLNGLSKQAAEKELTDWLERFQISANRKKMIEELSKGNQQKVLSFLPFWTPTLMLVRLAAGTVYWWDIALSIVLMLVTICACAWFSVRIYRFGVLMYGQKPGFGQLLKLARMN